MAKLTRIERAAAALEGAIAAIAPKWAFSRARSRMALNMARGYEAASKGRRTDGWKTSNGSANSETRSGLAVSRNRARDLVRNNPYALRGVSFIASSLVGYGIKTTPQSSNKKKSPKLLTAWNEWAESTDCDFDGLHNMYGMQELAGRTIVESGEVLIRRKWRKAAAGKIPMQIQILEPDFIDTAKEGRTSDGNEIIQGIEYDASGKRVAFWLFSVHPGDHAMYSRVFNPSARIAADEVLHVYRVDRPGQVRGISWLAPVVIRLRDFDEYEDAQLVRQKIAACFTAFVYDQEGAENTGAANDAELFDRMEPALIQRLGPGQNVTLASPPSVQGYSEYTSVTLHGIATGLQIPYEALTGDYSQVNFTSGRMGRTDFFNNLDVWQWNMFIPKFCAPIFQWWLQAASLAGLPAQGASAKFTPPRRSLTDPTREIPAIIKAVRGGIENMPNALRSMGYDPEEFVNEIAEFNALLDAKKVVLDSDPRKVTNSGQAQAEAVDPVTEKEETA